MAARTRARPRPRFSLSSALTPSEIRARTTAHIKTSSRLRGLALEDRIELAIHGPEHNFWSPQLVVQVRPGAEGGSELEARFGPDPYVWALYLLLNGVLLMVTLWAVIFGLVQWSLSRDPSALWVAPGAVVLSGLVYGASFVGQGLGSEQMYFLRATLSELCEERGDEPD